jgi:hypothetical protein
VIPYGKDYPDTESVDDGPADGAAVLDHALGVLVRFCVLPSREAAHAVVLWCAATHALPSLPAAPRLVITSPVKRAGKTRLLDVIEGISHDPLPTMNATAAAVFRSLDRKHPPTLIFDEVDTIFGSKRVAENNEDLRGLLNAGFQRGKSALRCVGPLQKPTLFATFAMAALAGIGGLPDTITDRAVNIRMRRRKADETVSPFRERRDRPALTKVHDRLAEWLADAGVVAKLEAAEPEMDLEDRAADVWEPLIAVADVAGGHWPTRARDAALKLTAEAAEDDDETLGLRLLHDLRQVFEFIMSDFVPTEILLQHLRQLDDAPWQEMDLTGHRLGALLREFQIKSKRDTAGQKRGYARSSFVDAWERYPVRKPSGDEEPPEETSEASGSVNTTREQGKQSDTCSDASDGVSEVSDEASDGFRRSDPVLTQSDGSDASPAGSECKSCGKGSRFGLIEGLCRACRFAGRAAS